MTPGNSVPLTESERTDFESTLLACFGETGHWSHAALNVHLGLFRQQLVKAYALIDVLSPQVAALAAAEQSLAGVQYDVTRALDQIRARHADGAHHKQWLLDQVVRLLAGDKYADWVRDFNAGEDGPDTYTWDTGSHHE